MNNPPLTTSPSQAITNDTTQTPKQTEPQNQRPHASASKKRRGTTFLHRPRSGSGTNRNGTTRPSYNPSSTYPNIQVTNPQQKRGTKRPTQPAQSQSALDIRHNDFHSHAHISPDGRIHISFNQLKSGPLAALLDSSLQNQFSINVLSNIAKKAQPKLENAPPRLNIVIMVIGSRGDIQPFIKLAKELVGGWGHRVRIATHPEFKEFVEKEFEDMEKEKEENEEKGEEGDENEGKRQKAKGGRGEFFSVGGDPQELMAFMVKNPGLLPSLETIKAGDIGRRRDQMFEMFGGFWRSCIEPSPPRSVKRSVSRSTYSDHTDDEWEDGSTPFITDAIIANPPSFAHVHCAEKLGIPLHLMFTFPYSPTQTIPHPLANIKESNVEAGYTNLISYSMVEMMTWQGLGDLVNKFRKKTLGLEPISTLWAPGLTARLKVPFTYLWSPSLIPKPPDWGPHIDISGFVFLEGASSFTPPDDLKEFLDKEPDNPPIYIGFGSIVVDDPDSLTTLIFDAVKETGVRALVSKGWGGLGGSELMEKKPDGVFMLENTPHDWLFPKVRAVIHHGGAGTTAIGLKCGKPTFVVSFFGDQPFWGAMLEKAGAGDWCPFKELDLKKLSEGIKTILKEEVGAKAAELADKIAKEGEGAQNAVMSFYRGLETVGITKYGGERGRKENKRKEKRPGLEPEDIASNQGVGLENTTAEAAAKEEGDENRFGMEKEKKDTEGGVNLEGDVVIDEDDGDETELIQGEGIRCWILEERVAIWRIRRTMIKLSALAAEILVEEGKFTWKDLRLNRHTEWNDFDGPGEPLSGGASAIVNALGGVVKGLFGVPYTLYKGVKRLDEDDDICKAEEQSKELMGRKKNPDVDQQKKLEAENGKKEDERNEGDKDGVVEEVAKGTGKGFKNVIKAGVRAPMDISLAVAQGFHNAPRLYGDTVRRPNRITGIHSGLRAAGKELTLGVYDGVTGVAVKPYQGAKAGGVPGFFKGVGKAAGGLFFKCNAGIAGLFGFPLKGVHKELRKGQERKVIAYIRDMRIQQGRLELEEILANGDDGDKEEQERLKERVLRGWELQERLEFNKKERDAQLKRDISGVQEIGRGQAKLHSLKKREQKRAKRWKKEALGSDSKEEKKDEDEDREETEEELKKKRVLGTGR